MGLEDNIREYLENHKECGQSPLTEETEEHDKLVIHLKENPEIIGVPTDSFRQKEVELYVYKRGIKNRIGIIDLIALTDKDLYIIEVKVIHGESEKTFDYSRNRMIKQLQRASGYFKIKFDKLPHQIGVFKQKNQLWYFHNRPK